jgi:hypothetical protein
MSGLHVETELDDVAVLDDVFFAFDAEFARFAGFALGAEGDGVVERKDRFKMQGEINNAFKPAQPIGAWHRRRRNPDAVAIRNHSILPRSVYGDEDSFFSIKALRSFKSTSMAPSRTS